MINFLATLMPRDRELRSIIATFSLVVGSVAALVAFIGTTVILSNYLTGPVATAIMCGALALLGMAVVAAAHRAERADEAARRLNESR